MGYTDPSDQLSKAQNIQQGNMTSNNAGQRDYLDKGTVRDRGRPYNCADTFT